MKNIKNVSSQNVKINLLDVEKPPTTRKTQEFVGSMFAFNDFEEIKTDSSKSKVNSLSQPDDKIKSIKSENLELQFDNQSEIESDVPNDKEITSIPKQRKFTVSLSPFSKQLLIALPKKEEQLLKFNSDGCLSPMLRDDYILYNEELANIYPQKKHRKNYKKSKFYFLSKDNSSKGKGENSDEM